MKRKEGRRFWAKFPSFFLLPLPGTEEAQGGGLGREGCRGVGENGEEAKGV
jgi:hypothetical protein